ncbi:hypothetical protein ACVMB3_003638 [Sinorhizobium meliloti]|nr:hypothetical protein SinmeB_0978 [Sinorhizobium meliloti BL225C]AEG52894.1 hypothetical protein Sinme_1143 [Sinorhizobium meliloti AK83]AGA06320.1 hypothetical protein C770_GR4Chr1367 [Sinorhizobium meliloti GR4]MBP2467637.1 hypothetical protein [Sinorhizobium meliloti]TWA86956.1 hypothetical protein FB000_15814 [Ensifer sp. SEMIA 134]TWB22850.1 hypothetical protein FB001_16114 [Ensifer sp. SEMIA 135]CCM67126.1 hypothetical protein BN406_01081 [Sinorhizobium meliloti Rm41]
MRGNRIHFAFILLYCILRQIETRSRISQIA